MIGGDPIGERVRATGVFGDIAADGAGALAGGIGRVEIAAGVDGQGDIQVDHPRLHHSALIFEVDFEDAVHACERNHEAALARDGAAGESCARAAAHDGHIEFARQFDQGSNFAGVAREGDQVRRVFVDTAIVFVQREVSGPIEIAARPQQAVHTFNQSRGEHRHSVDEKARTGCEITAEP